MEGGGGVRRGQFRGERATGTYEGEPNELGDERDSFVGVTGENDLHRYRQ